MLEKDIWGVKQCKDISGVKSFFLIKAEYEVLRSDEHFVWLPVQWFTSAEVSMTSFWTFFGPFLITHSVQTQAQWMQHLGAPEINWSVSSLYVFISPVTVCNPFSVVKIFDLFLNIFKCVNTPFACSRCLCGIV